MFVSLPMSEAGTNWPSTPKPTDGSGAPSRLKFVSRMTTVPPLSVLTIETRPVAMDMLRDESVGDGDTRIAKVFQSIPKSVHGGDRRGCMLCSAAAGPAFDDDGIAVVVNGLLDQLRDAFSYALGPRAPAGLAGLLVTQYVGLRILSRAQTSVGELEKCVAAVIEMVGPRDI